MVRQQTVTLSCGDSSSPVPANLYNIQGRRFSLAVIYKIENIITGRIYIGQTKFSIEKRMKEHCQDSKKDRCKFRPLYSDMNKYGCDNFVITALEETSCPEEREKYYIQKYQAYILCDSPSSGYNATLGGSGREYGFSSSEQMIILNMYKDNKTIKEISMKIGHDVSTISKFLKSKKVVIDGYSKTSHKVLQIDVETDEVVAIYESISQAGRVLDNKSASSHIGSCCKGKRKSAYGFKWKYI